MAVLLETQPKMLATYGVIYPFLLLQPCMEYALEVVSAMYASYTIHFAMCTSHEHGVIPGLQIALGADFRFATSDCRLSIMEAKWGLVPDMSGSITLRELISIDKAKELTMTGRVIDGVQAAEIGLVTRCVNDPMVEAEKIAKEILERCVKNFPIVSNTSDFNLIF